jgi:hypothetical protein
VLCPLVSQLGQRFGAGDAHADGDTNIPGNGSLYGPAKLQQVFRSSFDPQEGFVDAVNLQPGGVPAQQFHDACADVAIELVIAGLRNQAPFLRTRGELEPGLAGRDAKGLGFRGAGDGAAVIVGEYDQRFSLEGGIEGAFGAGVKAVHVHVRNLRHLPHDGWSGH